ncbi:methyltransferase domain-containing protein [Roseisolibacter sp. H3M3-2]|uniref:class I SAM-dependent methyltransferase n=1 Tax=Roseisolibacter sp. H3M3-2 TaxID=3031323 RepID=UPI0023DA5CD1|nr:methyltransferase domain-containing protein [Roseisolibacter sp. H3M3-2]MDF1503697.1 methyltransferase domain-containing protein [Roseisolibacter sp. H3M3-2]
MRLALPLLALPLLAAAACRGGNSTPVTRTDSVKAGVVSDTGAASDSITPRGPRGAAADRFPAPSRPVSDIVAPRWSSEEARDDAGEARQVLDLLQVKAGMHVADVGAGDGYYSVRVAERVRPGGTVWAEDIEADYLRLLQRRLRANPLPNVVLTLGEPHDPRLPRDTVDVALLIHMYHEIEQPFGLLYNLWPSLKPNARVGILDTTRPTNQHGTPPALLKCELEAMGYRQTAFHTTAPEEYLAVFAAPATEADLTAPARVAGRLEALGCDRIARRSAQERP